MRPAATEYRIEHCRFTALLVVVAYISLTPTDVGNHNGLRAFASVAPTRHTIRGMKVMRVLLGIIFGVFLTIGFAYVYDASITRSSVPTAQTSDEQRPMVNWDVVSENWQGLSLSVRNTWNKLAAR